MDEGHLGQETEYALAFLTESIDKPSNLHLYREIQNAIMSLVKTKPGKRKYQREFFCENGGAFAYEFVPHAYLNGLIESKTPECSSASELLLYQKSLESLLIKAIPIVEASLSEQGFQGNLRIIKNCRDAQGNIYGSQENYETKIASSYNYSLLKICLALLFPLVLILSAIIIVEIAVFTTIFIFLGFLWFTFALIITGGKTIMPPPYKNGISKFHTDFVEKFHLRFTEEKTEHQLMKLESYLNFVGVILFHPYVFLWKLFAFKKQRTWLSSYFISRIIFSGAGTLEKDDSFCLSEKATAIKTLMRSNGKYSAQALFDTGNLLKKVSFSGMNLLSGKRLEYFDLLKPRQRLQYGMSDSNCAQFAEYLKIGITQTMLEI